MDHPVVDIGVVLDSIDIAAWVPQAEMYYLLVVILFQNQVQTEPLIGFLNQNVAMVVTYVAMFAVCGLVNVVCYHVACHTSETLTSNRTKVSPPGE